LKFFDTTFGSGRLRAETYEVQNVQKCKLSTQPEGGLKSPVNEGGPPKPTKRRGFLLPATGIVVGGTGTVVYCCYASPKFRTKLEEVAPFSLASYFSKKPLSPSEPLMIGDVNSAVKASNLLKTKEILPQIQQKQEQEVSKEKETPKSALPPPPPPPSAISEKQKAREEAERKKKQKQEEEAQENAAMEVNLEKLIERALEITDSAVKAQNTVIKTTEHHTHLMKKAMDDNSNILEKETQWQEVSDAFKARKTAVEGADKVVAAAKEDLNKLKQAIESGKQNKVTKRNKALITAQKNFNEFSSELNKIATQVSKAEAEAKVMIKYKDLVDKGRKQFKQELESIMPEVKIGDNRGKKMSEEELNSLIAHAHRRIEQLQKQLAEQTALEQKRVRESLEQQQKEDEKVATQKVADEAEKLRNEFLIEKEKWDAETELIIEDEVRKALARQTAAHSENLKDVLKAQEERFNKEFEMKKHAIILEQRQQLQAEMEQVAKQAQELWLACVALNGVIRVGKEGQVDKMEDQLKPLSDEIDVIAKAAGNHPFVSMIVSTLPEEALAKGVWTEDNLRERFDKVKTVCKRVALIDENGGSLFKYFWSYVYSVFTFTPTFAREETDEVELEKLDTITILAHADYWLQRGDLEHALRFMNQLQGEPRQVAFDWINEAKLLLETRQAAYALTAFASASGLG
ncbi:hypothetical protein KUTeg_005085, partial [Tegillarca granosa]